ncbi:MAG: methyltransferase protein [Trizodia sp. TS-e1964]|nr:MAG: methyltransferase protein [Trizodia sp. TS-e1964]
MDSPLENGTPIFYIGYHDSKRSTAVSDIVLNQAQDFGYDMLTTSITSSEFGNKVQELLSSHLSQLADPNKASNPGPLVIPALTPADTHIAPSDHITQLVAGVSPWIDICSPDPVVADVSKQVLNLEIAYAAFCGVCNVIILGPDLSQRWPNGDGLSRYARAIQEALSVGSYLQISIWFPMAGDPVAPLDVPLSLSILAREEFFGVDSEEISKHHDVFGTWDAWNVIRTNLLGYCAQASNTVNIDAYVRATADVNFASALSVPRHLPPNSVHNRWFSEPLRILAFKSSTFIQNAKGYPVLSKGHQSLIIRFMRMRTPPWFLLVDVGALSSDQPPKNPNFLADGFLSPSITADAAGSRSPTPAEAVSAPISKQGSKTQDPAPHLSYMRHLQRNQPGKTSIEKFGSGYQDYLQAPLQPLADNLESVTYEVFEKDPVKYDWYQLAIGKALVDWVAEGKSSSSPDGAVVIAVVGAGRGPLVTRTLRASENTRVPVEVWAVEKNPNAYVLLQRHNELSWNSQVKIVKSDMRSWKGPSWENNLNQDMTTSLEGRISREGPASPQSEIQMTYGKIDILVSELLGSFADNELSPECLDGVQHLLNPLHGISIPASYTAHLAPIHAPKLHGDISLRTSSDPTAPETPYVVMLHAIDILSSDVKLQNTVLPSIQQAWEFSHPIPESVLAVAELRRKGGLYGGSGGQTGGDGANEHNTRHTRLKFKCPHRGVVHGLAGYFETVLYGDVELSTRPDNISIKSPDMISWFPIYFPLKSPIYIPDNAELDVSMWRQTDDRKVWYEWMVEAFMQVQAGSPRIRLGCSELHSSKKNGCLM